MVLIHKKIALTFGVLGVSQLSFGVVIVICSTIIAVNASNVITPFWCGVPIVIVGTFSVICCITRSKCLLTTSLLLNLILCVIMLISTWLLANSLENYVLASSRLKNHSCSDISGDCDCNEETYKGTSLGCAGHCCCHANEQPVASVHNQQVVITQRSDEGFPPGIITYQPYYINQMPPPYSEVQTNEKLFDNGVNNQDFNNDPTAQINPAYGVFAMR
ncbi:uncharacterized protein LOC101237842 isoform X3 [Hydra vulgaris]|uniref:uncharacterized protein LOC101237842 isoform X3 n=1 Tax=Hydra vulgaris TaxID=6087 RepID=UPI001F5EE60F|nr:uncharacterized protein LOC101237842 isoform X4 [Hydra vulgaris]